MAWFRANAATERLPLDLSALEDVDGENVVSAAEAFADEEDGAEPVEGAALARIAAALDASHTLAALAHDEADVDEDAAALAALSAAALNAAREFRELAERSLDPFGAIVDGASDALAEARDARRIATADLRATGKACINALRADGALSDSQANVVTRQGRACVLVKAGRKPKGSAVLATSKAGGQFVEPPELIACNDALIAAEAAADAEELRVLIGLNRALASAASEARASLESAAQVDLACARAQHAAWIGGVAPDIVDSAHTDGVLLDLSGVFHPELLALLALPPLPSHCVSLLPDAHERAMAARTTHRLQPAPAEMPSSDRIKSLRDATSMALADHASRDRAARCIPIHATVGAECRSIVLTGPNAGGKTAVLRTLGVCCAMARAGIALPVDAGASTPKVPWFDRIFADIGDAQSLTQSLSTFGGAVRRWTDILAALAAMSETTTNGAVLPILVLLDEVGMGTDPDEGASLAASLLERLAGPGGVRLCASTTHHAACARLAAERPDFVPAAMRFDGDSLRPTYELIWNAIGESRALDVARRCGLPASVLDDATSRLSGSNGIAAEALGGERFTAGLVASLSASASAMAAKAESAASARARAERLQAEVSAESLTPVEHKQRAAALDAEDERSVAGQLEEARRLLSEAGADLSAKVAAGELTSTEAELEMTARFEMAAALLWRSREDAPDAPGATYAAEREQAGSDVWRPSPGDHVRVRTMKNKLGVVERIWDSGVENSGGGSEFAQWQLDVRVGSLIVSCTALDVEPPNWARRTAAAEAGGSGAGAPLSYAEYRERLNAQASAGSRRRTRGAFGKRSDTSFSSAPAEQSRLPFVRKPSNTLDVRGLRAEELQDTLKDALDGASARGYLFVVHGFGMEGVLMRLTRQTMSRHSRVLRWEVDEEGAGGATVAWMK